MTMLRRPPFHLDRLPLRFRWECTRRHPVYLQLWLIFQNVRSSGEEGAFDEISREPLYLDAAAAIGVFGQPIDPSVSFEELNEDNTVRLFLRTSLQPMNVKQIVGVIMRMMSAQGLRRLTQHMECCADGKDELFPPRQVLADFAEFLNSTEPELNAYLDAPLYTVNPVAPRELLLADLVDVQSEWRRRLDLPDHRARSNDYPAYLEVWDHSEGFCDGQYNRDAVSSFATISRETGQPQSTIRNRYNRAFQLISGHAYSLENWLALMGCQQLGRDFGDAVSPVSQRRVRRPPSSAELDYSTVTGGHGPVEPNASARGNADFSAPDSEENLRRISRMINDGCTNDEIVDQTGMNDSIRPGIDFLRKRPDLRTGLLSDAEN